MRLQNDMKMIFSYLIFAFHRRNIISQNNTTYLKSCNYHHESDPLCPIFKLGTIVSDAGYDFNDVAYKVMMFLCVLE